MRKKEKSMKYRWILIHLVLCVTTIMLMSNALAATGPPIIWAAQATLNVQPPFPSWDPENSGFGTVQVAVWEEWDPINLDWNIHMKYSLADGAVGSWVFPALHPATMAGVDEINPAVSVTRNHGGAISQEIHVVYQRLNAGGFWEVFHTYTGNFGGAWSAPTPLNFVAGANAIDPAIVYTEDLAPRVGVVTGFLNQIVWAEETVAANGIYRILYDGHYYDPTMAPVRGYVGPTIIRTNPNPGLSCMKPEIASVDDRSNFAAFDYTFSVVWHEGVPSGVIPPTQWNVWYNDGTTVTSPAPGTVLTPGSLGIINVPGNQVDAIEPDIAATQDNQTNETYFFHITYEFKMWTPLSPQLNSIESHFSCGPSRTPGAASFIITPTVRGPTPIQLENPTIASKLISLGPTVFESWVAWEDYSNVIPANVPDIWFRMGTYTVGTPNVVWAVPPGIVGYALANVVGTEYNPEFWNRNDATRMFPTLTHLVFEDWTPAGAVANIIYIDP